MNIVSFLEKEKNSRKIFGKKEIEIIKKQLNGLQLTQSEKNRLSRDIRPKLEFIKNANNYKEEFRLEKNSINEKLIEEAKVEILKDKLSNEIKAILLFGSFVKKEAIWRSDIDICVVFKKNIIKKKATLFRKRLMGKISSKIDLQVFSTLPVKIKKEIAMHHKVLYPKNFDDASFTKTTIINALETEQRWART